MIDIVMDALHDTWLMIPLLFAVYLLIDWMERRPSKDDGIFRRLQKYGPFFGALLGLIPQCGFSILASILFLQKNITIGTMIAVFLATSDEAVPILISEPAMIPSLAVLLVLKFVIAALSGTVIDRLLFRHQQIVSFDALEEEEDESEEESFEQENQDSCPCCYPQYPLWLSALLRTLKIYLFIFLVTVALNAITESIGEERLGAFLMSAQGWQPLAASLFGFIPNCAATVVLCQLYAAGALTFGSLTAGLLTNAGLGLAALIRYGLSWRELLKIALLMLIPALISGYAIQLLQTAFTG